MTGEERRRGDSDWFFSACITLFAFLPRLYVAIAWPREPVWDGHYYDFGARRIAAGLGYSDGVTSWHPWCHWPVGYSGFLAGVYRVFGTGPKVATIAGAVVSALTVLVVHRLARHWLSRSRARLAALLCALYPGLIVYSALVMSEPLAAFLLALAGLVALRDRKELPLWGSALAGVILGLGTLVRPTFILHAPAIALLHFDFRDPKRTWRRALATASLATVTALAVVTPWTLRNCRVMDGCAFVSTNGGWNLAIGALHTSGRFETLRASDGCAVVTGQVQQDRCWRDRAIEVIAEDPIRWLSLIPKKLGHTFDHESYPIEYLREADPDRWPEPKRVQGRATLSFFHRALLTAAAFSVVAFAIGVSRRKLVQMGALVLVTGIAAYAWHRIDAPFWPLAVAIVVLGALPLPGSPRKGPAFLWLLYSLGSVIVTHAILFGEDRYHVVVTPMLCILAAGALRRQDVSHRVSRDDEDAGMPSVRPEKAA